MSVKIQPENSGNYVNKIEKKKKFILADAIFANLLVYYTRLLSALPRVLWIEFVVFFFVLCLSVIRTASVIVLSGFCRWRSKTAGVLSALAHPGCHGAFPLTSFLIELF